MAKTPVAKGSSVPACPAFWALNRRRTFVTARVEERPLGLSRTTQPCTGAPLRLRAIVILGRGGCLQVASHALGMQNLLDALRFGKRSVLDEAKLGGELQRNCAPQLAPQEAAMTVQRIHDRG